MPSFVEGTFVCNCCGDRILDVHMSEVDCVCTNCAAEYKAYSIHNYSYKPIPNFHYEEDESGTLGEIMYYGMELEVAVPCHISNVTAARVVKDPFEHDYYFKDDSSIGRGFEIVTHPRTFLSWHRYWDKFNAKVLLPLRKMGCTAHNSHSCGIHIHTSLGAWEGDHLYRCFLLFYNPAYYENLRIIAQRQRVKLNHYASLRAEDIGKFKRRIEGKISPFAGHYAALNITGNTLEIRIFNSNLRIERVRKNMEFVLAVYEYTKQAQRVSWRGFLRYIREHRYKFGFLYNFMEEKNLLNVEIDECADIDFGENEGIQEAADIQERVNSALHDMQIDVTFAMEIPA